MTELLWQPTADRIKKTNMFRFIHFVNASTYDDIYHWSIEYSPSFWKAMWEFGEIQASRSYDQVVTNFTDMVESEWFVGTQLNFAQNLSRYRDERTALVFKSERNESVRMSYATLYDQVARLAKSLREMGVEAGDRVAGFVPNMSETVIAMLATTSIGAIWTSCSLDFGIRGG